jgi:hypothetical protein
VAYDDPELAAYKASQRFKGNFSLPKETSMMTFDPTIPSTTQSRNTLQTLENTEKFIKKKKNWGLPKKKARPNSSYLD